MRRDRMKCSSQLWRVGVLKPKRVSWEGATSKEEESKAQLLIVVRDPNSPHDYHTNSKLLACCCLHTPKKDLYTPLRLRDGNRGLNQTEAASRQKPTQRGRRHWCRCQFHHNARLVKTQPFAFGKTRFVFAAKTLDGKMEIYCQARRRQVKCACSS